MTADERPTGTAAPREDGALAVSGMLTFDTVPEVYEQSQAWLRDVAGTLTVDLGGVQRADSAGIALLVQWLRRARARGAELRFTNVPEQVSTLARVSGLSRALGINSGPAGERS